MSCGLLIGWRQIRGGWRGSCSHFVTHVLLPVGSSPRCHGQQPGLQLLHIPRILLQPLRLLRQVCVFSSLMKGPGFWGDMHSMKVKGNKNRQEFQSIFMEFQLRLLGSRLSLVSATFHPSFLPTACPVDFMLQHQMQKQRPHRGHLTSSCCCKSSNNWNRPVDLQVHIHVCSGPSSSSASGIER